MHIYITNFALIYKIKYFVLLVTLFMYICVYICREFYTYIYNVLNL